MSESRVPLLEPHELAELGPPEAVRLPLDLVDENPANPRRVLIEVEALADNIRALGLQQPVTVRRIGERYELLGGHRRRAAFLLLREAFPLEVEWRTIPAVVKTANDDTSYLMLISAQIHNRNWSTREEATALERLAETHNLRQVGALVHRGESWVSKRLRIYSDSVLSGFVQAGKIPPTVAHELLLVPDVGQRREFAERAASEDWGQTTARAEVRKLKASKMVAQIGRLAHDLLEALALVQPAQLPPETTATLWRVRGRIVALGRGGPVLPSIEQAEQVAGVRTQARPKRTRLRIT